MTQEQDIEHKLWPLENMPPVSAQERWHEMLTSRYVCEACLTRYFMKYHKCKACGQMGRIRLLTASLFDLADSDDELREMIANGQRIIFAEQAAEEDPAKTDEAENAAACDFEI